MLATWAPSLEQVAGHIPARTRATDHPGNASELAVPQGTFNGRTSPTNEVAQRFIASAVSQVLGRVGVIPATPTHLAPLATAAAALRAAADIELAYSDRDAARDADRDALRDVDVQIYRELDRRATTALDELLVAVAQTGEGPSGSLLPQWQMPDPPAWGDEDL